MYPNVKLEIFKRGIRQKQLAKALGMRESSLSKIINGYREPSDLERHILSAYFSVDEEWLFRRYEIRSDYEIGDYRH